MNPIYDDTMIPIPPDERSRRQIKEERLRSAGLLDGELRDIERMVDPTPSFLRGVQFGALIVGAFNLFAPAAFGVPDWPSSVRVMIGFGFLLLGLHVFVRQTGFMKAQKINRAVRP